MKSYPSYFSKFALKSLLPNVISKKMYQTLKLIFQNHFWTFKSNHKRALHIILSTKYNFRILLYKISRRGKQSLASLCLLFLWQEKKQLSCFLKILILATYIICSIRNYMSLNYNTEQNHYLMAEIFFLSPSKL